MKTKNPIQKILMAATLLACFVVPGLLKAQLPMFYPITNNLPTGCDVEVSYNLVDSNNGCSSACGLSSHGTITVTAGSTGSILTCAAADDIQLTVLWMGTPSCTASQANTPVSSIAGCGNGSSSSISTGCTCASASINVTGTGATIN